MGKLKIAFKVMLDTQKWPATLEACDRMDSDPSLSEADRALVAQMRQALTQRASGVKLKRPGERPKPIKLKGKGPSASEQVIADRDIPDKVPNAETRVAMTEADAITAARDITAESLADHEAGKTFSWDELWAKIDAGPHWDEVLASLEMERAIATQGLNKEALALLKLLGLSGEDVAAGRVSTFADALSKIRDGDPIPADIRAYIRKKHKKPAPPGDMEGVLSELERLRIEVEELRADRDHWMGLWQRAANELLRRTPPSTIKLPGAGDQTAAVLNILDLGMEAKATRDLDPTEVRMSVRLHPEDEEGLLTDAPSIDEIQAEVREVRRARAKRKGTL